MKKDIKQLIADYITFTDEHPRDTSAQLFTSEISDIINASKARNGQNDLAYAIMNAYAVGFMTAAKRYGKEG